jgi:DNA-binding transcriptional LysR family regulator
MASVELRHLRYFVAVAEELHFGRAAVRLQMAQPPLSQQIQALERELGVALLHRTTRRVSLTGAGTAFLMQARRVLEQTERAVRTAQRTGNGEIGHLAIGFVPSADLDILPRALRLFRARFPGAEVELHSLLPGQQIEALREGQIHLGILRLPIDDRGLVLKSIQREPMVAALPAKHPLARCARIRMADFKDEAMIVFPRRTAPGHYDWLLGTCYRLGFTPRVLHETESLQTNIGLIAGGFGVSLLPASIRNLRRAGVVYRNLVPPVPQVEMAAAYLRENPSDMGQAFLEILRQSSGR